MPAKRPSAARYEPSTKTIRSVPENYWLATMDSWDGAVDHAATARLFAASPRLLAAAESMLAAFGGDVPDWLQREAVELAAAVEEAGGRAC